MKLNFPAPKIKKSFLGKIEEITGPRGYSLKTLDRFNYSRDSSFKSTIQIKYNKVECMPDLIVWPETTLQVQKLVKLAIRHKVPVTPFGAGSGVCGGTIPVKGGMIVDLKKMRHVTNIDSSELKVCAETGIMGMHLEKKLERRGFTLGHFPSSILCASLGGYLASRSAGQKSSRYGKIEDMVCDLEIVTGRGEIIQTRDVANGCGIDLNQLFVGSEGTLGIITKATLRIYPSPPARFFKGVRFTDFKTGMEAVRRIIQSGIKPAVLRLYDELDSLLFFSSQGGGRRLKMPQVVSSMQKLLKFRSLKAALMIPRTFQAVAKLVPTGCVFILVHEGSEHLVLEEQKTALEICRGLGGEDLGDSPGRYWHKHRYSVSYNASPLFYSGAFTDTIEVASTWDKMGAIYDGITKAISSYALVMAHLSHVYPEGGAFYFTFVAPLKGLKKSEELYDLIWDTALKTCQKLGGIVSHHHGIGRLKAKYMAEEWGAGMELFRALKDLYDPYRIMNPGKLVNDSVKAISIEAA